MIEKLFSLNTSILKLDYFNGIDDKMISNTYNNKLFIEDDYLYDKYDNLANQYNKEYDLKKIASLIYKIKNGTYDDNFYFRVWNNGTIQKPILELDNNIIYHIKAHQYLNLNMEIIVLSLN